MEYYNDDYLMHYGVKGMKWGVRRAVKKDAKEFARAKMYYGEGAGTRRKLIKATVEQRSTDPDYKKAFDDALSKQDMAKHATKAKRERKVNDVKNTVNKAVMGTNPKETLSKAAKRGFDVCASLATASIVDDIFYDGRGKKFAMAGIKAAGRKATEAYMKRHGSIDITWLD